jgi:zinc/manganese transport system substrate-binding protein
MLLGSPWTGAVTVRRRLPLLSAILAAAAGLTGCGALGPTGQSHGVQVVAAESTWGSVAAALAGRAATVTSIIANPAVDPHSYEPEAADARALAQANVAILNGLGYDNWAKRLLAADAPAARATINVGHILGLHDGDNPHRWYSPNDVQRIADTITAALMAAEPNQTAYLRARRAWFSTTDLARYNGLIAAIRSRDGGAPVGASESVFAPMAAALGLRLITPGGLLRAVSDGGDVSAGDMATAQSQIAAHAIRVWVLNTQNTTPNVNILTAQARAAGIPVVSMTETPSPATASFAEWQTRQLAALAGALGLGAAAGVTRAN